MKFKIAYWFLLILILGLFLPSVHSAQLTDYNISLHIDSNTQISVVEVWNVSAIDQNDLSNFKSEILKANLDLDKLKAIDPDLSPHVYLDKFKNVTISFDEINSSVRLSYITNGLVLEKFYENDDEILWQFNTNFLKNFLINNLYSIPDNSGITISVDSPLIIQDPLPKGIVSNNSLTWTGVSSSKLRLLLYEKKPPKPSFFLLNFSYNSKFYTFLFILILLILVGFIFRKRMSRSIKRFVVNHSVIKPEKNKEDLFDIDFLNK